MILEDPKDPDHIELAFPCLRARQPIGDIFIATISYKELRRITYFDVRRVLYEELDIERYLGIQRPLEPRRVEQLKKYVNFSDASFPTSIIIAVDQDYVKYDDDARVMVVSNRREGEINASTAIGKIARVLDGQHRIEGLSAFIGADFELSVTIFVGADISEQAQIFATVNLEQTKVNRSLVYDLYELARTRSPQKTCHNVAVALDLDNDSPLFHRIKRLGTATEGRAGNIETVTQSNFVDGLIGFISSDPKADRDTLLRGKKLQRVSGDDLFVTPFRNLFIDERDLEITQIVYNYFCAVRERWPNAWDEMGSGFVLNRTNGIRALLRFLRVAYLNVVKVVGQTVSKDQFFVRLRQIRIEDAEFTVENFVPGSSGETRLYKILRGDERI